VDIPEFDMTCFKLLHGFPFRVQRVDIGFMFQKSCDIRRSRYGFRKIWGKREKLTRSLCSKRDGHEADKDLDDGVFPFDK
jgi:hypothetical protein